jgi:hypothetical protein
VDARRILIEKNAYTVKHEESSKENEDPSRDSTTNSDKKAPDNRPELKVHYINDVQASRKEYWKQV